MVTARPRCVGMVRCVNRASFVPPPWLGATVIGAARRFRWRRTRAFEALGSRRFSATAQHGMDRWIAGRVGRSGYFIEAGANDGYRMSNTYLLERHYGWTGLLVEPIPVLAAACAARRPHSVTAACALVGHDYAGEIVEIQYADGESAIGRDVGEGWSLGARWGIESTYALNVPARTLTSLLDEIGAPSRPNLLSLDVEGYEPQVLAGLDFDRYAPRFVLLEDSAEGLADYGPEIMDRYKLLHRFPGNLLFEHV